MTTATTPPTPAKKPKSKGPIRYEAIVPMTLVLALIYAYFFLFFDTHLRHGLEYFGTRANGAEVNIESVKTSFWRASLEIRDIQVTDTHQPTQNLVQVGSVRWNMLWDALLRSKVAIEEASILDIRVHSPRKKAGRVLPKDPPGPSKVAQLSVAAIGQAQKQFEGNVLGDAAALLGGVDPKEQLKNIQHSLKSEARIKELQAELKNKEKEWKQRIDNLPKSEDIKALQARAKNVRLDFKNPAELQKNLKEIESIAREFDTKMKQVKETNNALNSDVNNYQNIPKQLEEMVQKDIRDLESRFQIPQLDTKSLTMMVFGPLVLDKLGSAQKYMNKAREYMPPPKTAEEKAAFAKPTPHERANGRNYKFGRPKSYPLFWLKEAKITSKSTNSEYSGDLEGRLQDLTDNPPILGRPTILSFKGDFPKQRMQGVSGEVFIDHTTVKPLERLTLKIASFDVKGQSLVDKPEIRLAFDKAQAASSFILQLHEEMLSLKLNNVFQNIAYQVAAKPKILDDILKGAVADVPRVTLDAAIEGSWSRLRFDIDSNLGRELGKALQRQVQAKIDEARAKLKAFIDEKIGGEKAKLNAELQKLTDQLKKTVAGKEQELAQAKGEVDKTKNNATKSGNKKIEEEGKKALDDLKKKFKF